MVRYVPSQTPGEPVRHAPVVVIIATAFALAACSGDGDPVAPDAGETATPAPTASGTAQPGEDSSDGTRSEDVTLADLEITTRGVGPFEVGMSIAALSALTSIDYSSMVDVGAACVEFPLSYAPPLSSMAVLAETGGFDGTVDTVAVFDWQFQGTPTPRTEDGLGLRSSLSEIAAVYGEALQTAPWSLDGDVTRAWVVEDDYGIQFLVDDEHGALEIVVGRVPQVTYEAGCP